MQINLRDRYQEIWDKLQQDLSEQARAIAEREKVSTLSEIKMMQLLDAKLDYIMTQNKIRLVLHTGSTTGEN